MNVAELAESLDWMRINGEPDLRQWERHIAIVVKQAREQGAAEMRDAILRGIDIRREDSPVLSWFDAGIPSGMQNIERFIKSLGPLFSLEYRVRLETVEKVRKSTAQIPNPDRDGCYITFDTLDAIAEGREP